MYCAKCDRAAAIRLPRGSTYRLVCPRCCTHHKRGLYEAGEHTVGYREGFRTWVCSGGCGTILKEEQLL